MFNVHCVILIECSIFRRIPASRQTSNTLPHSSSSPRVQAGIPSHSKKRSSTICLNNDVWYLLKIVSFAECLGIFLCAATKILTWIIKTNYWHGVEICWLFIGSFKTSSQNSGCTIVFWIFSILANMLGNTYDEREVISVLCKYIHFERIV